MQEGKGKREEGRENNTGFLKIITLTQGGGK
jgi:hypothetical protein